MRTLVLILAVLATATAPAFALDPPPLPGVRAEADGLTARISFLASASDLVLERVPGGDFVVAVSLFKDGPQGWKQVSTVATLRVFAYDPATQTDVDVVSRPFRSHASKPMPVTIPGDAIATGQAIDVFVTFSNEPGPRVPTSHHSVAKNAAIAQGDFDTADVLDYHHVVRPIAG